ncbi:MAG: DUF4870 domain-containing protein [Anaerolineaceae bacterium]|nr:MAG: DUF4870 domain-containing protein [Anaerolineaceae bacterium]
MEVDMSEQTASPSTTSEERLLVALAHGSVILSFFGPIVPALVWTFQRRKSPYVAFHALQAIGYQMLTFWVGMAAYLLFVLVFMLIAIPLMGFAASNSRFEMTPFILQGSMFFFMFGFMGIYVLFGIVGAVSCLLDKDFKYPILGKWLEKYLGRGASPTDPLDADKEDQWMAAMGHASAILLMWGLFTPFAIWLTQKDSSPRLRYQSLQAVIYQLFAVAGYFVFMALYMFMFFALFAGAILMSGSPQDSTGAIFVFVFFGIMLIFMLAFALAIPTYHLFAMIAGIQVAKGKDYHYPLLGKFLARRMGNQPPPSAD